MKILPAIMIILVSLVSVESLFLKKVIKNMIDMKRYKLQRFNNFLDYLSPPDPGENCRNVIKEVSFSR